MNVYDFDKTIYQKDSTLSFFLYCLRKNPKILKVLPSQLKAMLLWKTNRQSKEVFKEKFYAFLKKVPNVDELIASFWEKEIANINDWYLNQQQPNDLIISASPDFLIRPVAEKIGCQQLLASLVDKETGQLLGPNCYGAEKVIRFKASDYYGEVNLFYSDSMSDAPMGELANTFILVDKYGREKNVKS